MRWHVIRLLQHRQQLLQLLQTLQGGATSLVPGQHSKPGGAQGDSRQQAAGSRQQAAGSRQQAAGSRQQAAGSRQGSAQDSAQGEGGCGADSAVQLVMLAVADALQQLHQQRRLRHAVRCWRQAARRHGTLADVTKLQRPCTRCCGAECRIASQCNGWCSSWLPPVTMERLP
jgi:hypothetical protein